MSSQPIKNVIVVGGSGAIGAPIVKALLASGKFTVSVLSRASSTATFPAGVAIKKVDFASYSSLIDALKGQDAVIATLNDAGSAIQVPLIEAAVEAGVRRFFPSEWEANGPNHEEALVPELQEAMDGKKAIIKLLEGKVAEAAANGKEFHWTAVSNGLFFDWSLKTGFVNINLPPAKTATVWDSGNNLFSTTNLETVAKAVVSILSTAEEKTRDRFVYIESFKASQHSIIAALEKSTGEKWAVEQTTTKEQLAEATKVLQEGDFFNAYVRWLLAGLFSGNKSCQFSETILDNKLLGLGDETLEGSVREVIGSVQK